MSRFVGYDVVDGGREPGLLARVVGTHDPVAVDRGAFRHSGRLAGYDARNACSMIENVGTTCRVGNAVRVDHVVVDRHHAVHVRDRIEKVRMRRTYPAVDDMDIDCEPGLVVCVLVVKRRARLVDSVKTPAGIRLDGVAARDQQLSPGILLDVLDTRILTELAGQCFGHLGREASNCVLQSITRPCAVLVHEVAGNLVEIGLADLIAKRDKIRIRDSFCPRRQELHLRRSLDRGGSGVGRCGQNECDRNHGRNE